MASLTPLKLQLFLDSGQPAALGKIYTWDAGTTTPLVTYANKAQTVENTNPVILDAAGRAELWLGPGTYDIEFQDANGFQIWYLEDVQGSVQREHISDIDIFSGWVNSATAQWWQFTPAANPGRKATGFEWLLECISVGDGQFIAGDEIIVTNTTVGNGGQFLENGLSMFYYSQNGALIVKDKKAPSSGITLTASRWRLRCRAWYL